MRLEHVELPGRETRFRSLGRAVLPLFIVVAYELVLPTDGVGNAILLVAVGAATLLAMALTLTNTLELSSAGLSERRWFRRRHCTWPMMRGVTIGPGPGRGFRLTFEAVDGLGLVQIVSASGSRTDVGSALSLLLDRDIPVRLDERVVWRPDHVRSARTLMGRHGLDTTSVAVRTGRTGVSPMWLLVAGIASAVLLQQALVDGSGDAVDEGELSDWPSDFNDENFGGVPLTMRLDCSKELHEQVPAHELQFVRAQTVSGSRLLARRVFRNTDDPLLALWTPGRLIESTEFEWNGGLDDEPLEYVWVRTERERLWFACTDADAEVP